MRMSWPRVDSSLDRIVLRIASQGFSRFELALSLATIVGAAPSLLTSARTNEASRSAYRTIEAFSEADRTVGDATI
jgi:hypothetical protein